MNAVSSVQELTADSRAGLDIAPAAVACQHKFHEGYGLSFVLPDDVRGVPSLSPGSAGHGGVRPLIRAFWPLGWVEQ